MSQQDGATKKIGDRAFTMYMLPPRKSHNLLMDLFKMIGPTMGTLFDGFMGKGKGLNLENIDDLDLGPDFFSKSTKQLFEAINKETLDSIIDALQTVTVVDPGGKLADIFDAIFLGKLPDMYAWLIWGMQVQWGKSLSALAKEATSRGAKVKTSRSQSPSTSTG